MRFMFVGLICWVMVDSVCLFCMVMFELGVVDLFVVVVGGVVGCGVVVGVVWCGVVVGVVGGEVGVVFGGLSRMVYLCMFLLVVLFICMSRLR